MLQVPQPLTRVLFRKLALLILLVGAMTALLKGAGTSPGPLMPVARLGGSGYWLAGSGGAVHAFGAAQDFGGIKNPPAPIATLAGTSSGKGYWLTTTTGEVFARGDAVAHGGMGGTRLNKPIVGMAPTPTGKGYWLVASDGGVFSFGDAGFFGSMGGKALNKPIVGMTPTASGEGYWFVASDGGLFAFGDAGFFGSMGATKLNKPVVGMAASRTGRGYRMVAADGGIFSFGDAGFYGSTGDQVLNKPIRSMAATPSGNGYWFVAADGGIFSFGDAVFSGSAVGRGQEIVGMAAANALPRADDDAVATNEDVAVTIDVLANDQNLTDNPISLAVESDPSAGTASVEAGRIVYRPDTDANGTDSLIYRVTDGDGDTAVGQVSITVRPVNDPPGISTFTTAGSGHSSIDIDEDSQGGVQFSVVDQETAAGSLTIQGSSNNPQLLPNANITFSGSGNERTMSFRPAADQTGTSVITVTVSDGQASSARTFTVNVRQVNDAPRISSFPSNKTIEEDTSTGALDFAISDSETSASALDVTAASDNGTLVGSSGMVITNGSGGHRILTVTPEPSASGAARITVTVSDGELRAIRSFVLTVKAVNDTPVVTGADLSATEDGAAVSGSVSATDEEGTPVAFALGASPAKGDATVDADGTVHYTPRPDQNGADSFTVTASDGNSAGTAAVTVTIEAVNDTPAAFGDVVDTDEDVAVTIPVLANDTGTGDRPVTVTVTTGPTSGTTAVNADGTITYTPAAQWSGLVGFDYLLTDADGQTSSAHVTVDVHAVDDAPVADPELVITNEDTAEGGQLTASDVENSLLTFSVVTGPAHGDVSVSGSGLFTYTPDADWNGTDRFTFKVNDGGQDSAPATVTVTVNAVNDTPAAVLDSATTAEDTAVMIPVLDNDSGLGDGIDRLEITSGPSPEPAGTPAVNLDGTITFTPAANWNGTATFAYRVIDADGQSSSTTVSVTVTAVNDAPTLASIPNVATNEDRATSEIALTVGDVDTATALLSLSGSADPDIVAEFSFSGSGANRTLVMTPKPNAHGTAAVTITVSDGSGGKASRTFTLTVNSINDVPTAPAQTFTATEDTPYSGTLIGSDVENDPITFALAAQAGHGSVTIRPDGTFDYTPTPDFAGTDTFTFTVSDGAATSAPVSATLTVTNVNDAPVAQNDTVELDLLGSAGFNVLDNDRDADGDNLTVTITSPPAHGVLLCTNGQCTITDGVRGDSFAYQLEDPSGATSVIGTVTFE